MKLITTILSIFAFLLLLQSFVWPNPQQDNCQFTGERIEKSSEEWSHQLSEMEYYVTRESGTERAFTGTYWDAKESGIYQCICCSLPLFESNTKFKSGTGWPSFTSPINETNVCEIADYDLGWNRVEVICARCDAHLGHVFEDGPEPNGLRYCINSVSLQLNQK